MRISPSIIYLKSLQDSIHIRLEDNNVLTKPEIELVVWDKEQSTFRSLSSNNLILKSIEISNNEHVLDLSIYLKEDINLNNNNIYGIRFKFNDQGDFNSLYVVPIIIRQIVEKESQGKLFNEEKLQAKINLQCDKQFLLSASQISCNSSFENISSIPYTYAYDIGLKYMARRQNIYKTSGYTFILPSEAKTNKFVISKEDLHIGQNKVIVEGVFYDPPKHILTKIYTNHIIWYVPWYIILVLIISFVGLFKIIKLIIWLLRNLQLPAKSIKKPRRSIRKQKKPRQKKVKGK